MKPPKTQTKTVKIPVKECVLTFDGSHTPKPDYKLISLTQGKYAIVDAEDYLPLSKYKWRIQLGYRTYYAIRGNGKDRIYMHQQINPSGEGLYTDHRNGKGFDNRRINIRHCNHSQNMQNRHKYASCTSRFKGVCYEKTSRKWRVQIIVNNIRYRLGRYKSELQAAEIYDQKAKELCGEYACTNF